MVWSSSQVASELAPAPARSDVPAPADVALITADPEGSLQPLPLGRALVASGLRPEEALLLRVSWWCSGWALLMGRCWLRELIVAHLQVPACLLLLLFPRPLEMPPLLHLPPCPALPCAALPCRVTWPRLGPKGW